MGGSYWGISMGWFKGAGAPKQAKAGFLSNLRFRAKIMLGFAVVLGISAINMGVAYFGFERVSAGIQSYQDIVSETDSARDIDRELTSYQLLARYYAVTGMEADEKAARASEAQLGKAIERAAKVASGENREKIQKLSGKFSEFAKLFANVVQLKNDNASLASNQLLRVGNTLRYKFDDLGDTAVLAGLDVLQATVKELATQSAAITAAVRQLVARPEQAIDRS